MKEIWLKEIIVFVALSGMRREEITNLRWGDIDFQKKVILIQSTPTFRTKQGKLRFVPMNDLIYQLLTSKQATSPTDYVFTLNEKKVWTTG